MTERVAISRLGSAGDGVAETPDGPLHIPFALPGETVLVERDGKRARMVALEHPSPARVDPFCPHFTRCGGCVFQHLEQEAYAEWKHGRVVSALARTGLDVPVGPLVDAHGAGRRRLVLHVRSLGREVRAGFMQAGTHHLEPIARCPIAVPALDRGPAVAEALARHLPPGKPLDAAVTATSAGLDVDLRGSGRPSERAIQALIDVAREHDLARLSLHGDVLIAIRRPAIPVGPGIVIPPPGSFLQATQKGEEVLGAIVLAAATGARRVVDLFSGIGPFALRLAGQAEVHAVEGQAAMLQALDRAARETPGLRRVTTEARDLFRRPLLADELDRFDLAVIDPPRQGAEAQIRQIVPSSLDRVIMVSCDPGTFARDAAILVSGGFGLEAVRPVDQFKWSTHVEFLGVFSRASRAARPRPGRAGRRA